MTIKPFKVMYNLISLHTRWIAPLRPRHWCYFLCWWYLLKRLPFVLQQTVMKVIPPSIQSCIALCLSGHNRLESQQHAPIPHQQSNWSRDLSSQRTPLSYKFFARLSTQHSVLQQGKMKLSFIMMLSVVGFSTGKSVLSTVCSQYWW